MLLFLPGHRVRKSGEVILGKEVNSMDLLYLHIIRIFFAQCVINPGDVAGKHVTGVNKF